MQRQSFWAHLLLILTVACGGGGGDGTPERDGGESPDGATMDASRPPSMRPDAGPPPECGNGIVERGEACDDENQEDGDGCRADCSAREPGHVCPEEGGECVPVDRCGNGLLEDGEECDDRNLESDDGCTDECDLETGWACPVPGAVCRAAMCGDGIIAGVEECDDGPENIGGGDGCDEACNLEPGYVCETVGEACRMVPCGDGVTEGTEQCDDTEEGEIDLPGDGCFQCFLEPDCTDGMCAANCGDGFVIGGLEAEDCDDGNTRSGDGCSATCVREDGFDCVLEELDLPEQVSIPIVFRDFRASHIDFENANAVDRNAVQRMLDADGKPRLREDYAGGTIDSQASFSQWYRNDPPHNMTVVSELTLDRQPNGTYLFQDDTFFPLDGTAFTTATPPEPEPEGHNFHFTSELKFWFTYDADVSPTLEFAGDDDVWVFINRRLAVDIGGVHGVQTESVTIDAAKATELGLHDGGVYEIVLFHAERHTSASNFKLTLSGFVQATTQCTPICGDAILTPSEVCDDGVNDGSYGSCTDDCLGFGPHCGDGNVQEDHEECDDGFNLGGYNECAEGCVWGPRCGDGEVQRDEGERCDDGNDIPDDTCHECQPTIG